ncbi:MULTISPECIES: patatin-like phospholipase family protein [Tissierellales]|jgi:NTE family protein|uniref:Patatin-like phospholipase family protein n=1 Tax=Acidilutibacter cellobiosedens TaxID=2507161 RepID=A0A410QFL4_9FIRM|nr:MULTISPECIES: patatin-like phospholipase family protein [Tissierellales]MBE6083115.1 patatin-like phospholipase family protein [Tissierellaceae bacterium]QAT62797.1 patatin-like phospholipase family protein [Acidilutibacter cellobiosedens]SCL93309.1 NTE family protein RssA [Sporanaerobacter sp. PP17-6a]
MRGLVLEGGGAKGAYHIGAYKALKEMGVEIDGVAGTSVGALNGAMIAQEDIDRAYELWNNMTYSRVINANDEDIEKIKKGKLKIEDIKDISEKIKGVISEKGVDITPLKELLYDVINEEKVRRSGKDFGIVTVSLTDLKPLEIYIEDIPQGKLVEYLMASAYLPVFKREKIDGKDFIDGGIYDNVPMGLLINKGYEDLIVVRTHGLGRNRRINKKNLNIRYISPRESLGRTLDFDTKTCRFNLKLGYFDAFKAIKQLKGNKYYIIPKKDENYFVDVLLNLNEEKILEIGKILKIEEVPYRRALFEFIIPKLNNILGLDKKNDYEDILIMFLEYLAEEYEMERFKIYGYEEFLENVIERHKYNSQDNALFSKLVMRMDILGKFSKSEIIKEIANIVFF